LVLDGIKPKKVVPSGFRKVNYDPDGARNDIDFPLGTVFLVERKKDTLSADVVTFSSA